jgi:hypothetical protein
MKAENKDAAAPGLPDDWFDDPAPPEDGQPGGPPLAVVALAGAVGFGFMWWLWSGWWPRTSAVVLGGFTAVWFAGVAADAVRQLRGRGE